jgi:hypothetical protein
MSAQPILELTVGAPVSWSPLLSMLAGLPFDAHFNLEILVARVLNSLKKRQVLQLFAEHRFCRYISCWNRES